MAPLVLVDWSLEPGIDMFLDECMICLYTYDTL